MESKYFYRTEVEWTGERHGDLRAPVLPSLKIDAPPEFQGHEGVWTPEHLFVASVLMLHDHLSGDCRKFKTRIRQL